MSNETKFTPGPWKAYFGGENNRVLIGIGEETGEGIADCGDRYWRGQFGMWRGKDEDAAANAHLITAAPDLYAALSKAREFVRIFTPREDHLGDKAKDVAIAIDAAMAKARGEQ
jgi:hypothetical protein